VLIALFAAAASLALAPYARAAGLPDPRKGEPVEITADEIVYDVRAKVYIAEGSVRIEQADRSLEADWLVFNRVTQRGIASGQVVLVDGDEQLEARFVEFDYATQQGLVFRGRLDMGPDDFIIGAEEFVKTGKDTYTAHDASFTTCRCEDPESRLPWQLNAEDGNVEIGGYATTTNTSVDILGVPTIWLPWMFFPIKTERESGFLFPQMGYQSQNGFEIGIPYFWAARHNVNVTVVPRYLTTTGFKPEVEVEAVYGKDSETELFLSYVRDQDARRSARPGFEIKPNGDIDKQNVAGVHRWGLGFDNDAHLPYGVRARSKIRLISDNDYVRDFREFSNLRRDRFVESDAFAFGHYTADGSATFVGGIEYVNDRQNPDYEDRDKFVLQRVPAISANWLTSPVPSGQGFMFEFDSDYTYFKGFEQAEDDLDLGPMDQIRGSGSWIDIGVGAIPFDDLPNAVTSDAQILELIGYDNGQFDEGEPLNDDGHRVILYPRVSRPFRLFGVDVKPEVGWQQTLYSTRERNTRQRGLFTARADVSSQLVGGVDVPFLGHVEHVLEPKLGWALVQHQSQRKNPLFVPETATPQTRLRQMSLDNVVLDDADRINSANLLTLGFGNRFYGGEVGQRRLLAELDVSWGYDFAGKSAGQLQDLILEGRTFYASGLSAQGILGVDMDKQEIEEVLVNIQLPKFRDLPFVKELELTPSYRYRRDIPLFYEFFPTVNAFKQFETNFQHINQVSAVSRLEIDDRWAVGYRFIYSIENRILQRNAGFVEYTSSCNCWAARIDINDSRTRGAQVNFRVAILGLGNDDGSPFARRGIGTSAFE